MYIKIPTPKTYTLVWSGKAIRINRRYSIGSAGSGYKRKPILRLTADYRNFLNDLAMQFTSQYTGPPITGPVAVFLAFSLSRKGNDADTDAYNKQVLDALELGGVIENDNQVIFHSALNAGGDKTGKVDMFSVVVMELDGDVELMANLP